MTGIARSSGIHKPRGEDRRREDPGNLRAWLHLISERADSAQPNDIRAIREAALSALRGDRAPKRFGLIPEE